VPRPTGFADLAARRVGVFGYGVEGRAAAARLRALGLDPVVVDDADLGDEVLQSSRGGHEALLTCEVVLKSPGIPGRRDDVTDLEAHGVVVTSALNLWLHDTDRARVVAVTGTKGKSTTTALITFFLHCLGEAAQSLGNIGLAPYSPEVDTSTGWCVVEVSSFQVVDLDLAPATVVITSLGSDHLDWHGSLAQYQEDKLSLAKLPGVHETFVPDTSTFHELAGHLGDDVAYVAPDATRLAAALGLLGAHNDANVGLALAVVASLTSRAVGEVAASVAARASDFSPLRGRLTLIATTTAAGAPLRFVDDGLATSPLPVAAALDVFADDALALIAGGFDRGVDYRSLARALARRVPATHLFALGPAGARLATLVAAETTTPVENASSMLDAVTRAAAALDRGGVVLFSPGAPSFDAYRDWLERSEDFARCVREVVAGTATPPA
jgi:UDP-N-acetylmuramoyl-L-alanine---L-glutamate ligase